MSLSTHTYVCYITIPLFVQKLSIDKILVVCLSVCLSVHYGRSAEMIWPRDTRGYIPGPRALQARTRRSLWGPAMALATGTSTSFLYGLYKTKPQMGTYIQWPAVKQTARFGRRHCPSGHHGGSRFWFWLLAYSSLARGATSKLTSFWTVD